MDKIQKALILFLSGMSFFWGVYVSDIPVMISAVTVHQDQVKLFGTFYEEIMIGAWGLLVILFTLMSCAFVVQSEVFCYGREITKVDFKNLGGKFLKGIPVVLGVVGGSSLIAMMVFACAPKMRASDEESYTYDYLALSMFLDDYEIADVNYKKPAIVVVLQQKESGTAWVEQMMDTMPTNSLFEVDVKYHYQYGYGWVKKRAKLEQKNVNGAIVFDAHLDQVEEIDLDCAYDGYVFNGRMGQYSESLGGCLI